MRELRGEIGQRGYSLSVDFRDLRGKAAGYYADVIQLLITDGGGGKKSISWNLTGDPQKSKLLVECGRRSAKREAQAIALANESVFDELIKQIKEVNPLA
jgi:hypothetical protein